LDKVDYQEFKHALKLLKQNPNYNKLLISLNKISRKFNLEIEQSHYSKEFTINIPPELKSKQLIINSKHLPSYLPKSLKKLNSTISSNQIPFTHAIKILKDFQKFRICLYCLQEHMLSYIKNIDDESVCQIGHVSKINLNKIKAWNDDRPLSSEKKTKKLTENLRTKQIKEFLKRKPA